MEDFSTSQPVARTFPTFKQLVDKALVVKSMRHELEERKKKFNSPWKSSSNTRLCYALQQHPSIAGTPVYATSCSKDLNLVLGCSKDKISINASIRWFSFPIRWFNAPTSHKTTGILLLILKWRLVLLAPYGKEHKHTNRWTKRGGEKKNSTSKTSTKNKKKQKESNSTNEASTKNKKKQDNNSTSETYTKNIVYIEILTK